MAKEIYTLPSDLGINGETSIYFYFNNKSSVKNKIIYTSNVLCLLLCGAKEVLTPSGKEIITSNDMMILNSGSVLLSESVSESNKSEAILIFFDNKILLDVCTRQKVKISSASKPKQLLKITRDDFINNYCHSLKLLRNENNTEINELKVYEILGYLSSKFPNVFERLVAQTVADPGVIKIQQIVELNSGKGLSIEELAFLCNMSVSTFKRHFVQIYGISPGRYFTQLKMEKAKLLLSLHKRPSTIYHELGYENLSAFSNEFKKYFGVSPNSFKSS